MSVFSSRQAEDGFDGWIFFAFNSLSIAFSFDTILVKSRNLDKETKTSAPDVTSNLSTAYISIHFISQTLKRLHDYYLHL